MTNGDTAINESQEQMVQKYVIRNAADTVRLSKRLTYLLRYGAEKEGITVHEGGLYLIYPGPDLQWATWGTCPGPQAASDRPMPISGFFLN